MLGFIRKLDVTVHEESSCARLFLYVEAVMTEIKQQADGDEFFSDAVNAAASLKASSHFSLVVLQRCPENELQSLTKFGRFKNSLANFCCSVSFALV